MDPARLQRACAQANFLAAAPPPGRERPQPRAHSRWCDRDPVAPRRDAVVDECGLRGGVSRNFVQGINNAVAQSRTPTERLRLVLEFFIRYTAQVKSDRMLEIEPTFVLKFLQSHFPQHLAVFNDALAPVYDDIEAHLGIPVNRSLVSEVLLRAEQSTVVVPAGGSWEALPAALSRMLEKLYQSKRRAPRRVKTR
jgi:hypothetical protein